MPTSVTFPRASSIPYFVVFTTTPRSADLAKEIAADATISISLVRQVTITEAPSLPPTPPYTPSTSNEDLSSSRPGGFGRVARSGRFRVVKPPKSLDDLLEGCDKPLPRLPAQVVLSVSHTLQNTICIGFPKRPRHQGCEQGSHPSLSTQASLPDGLHKDKIQLNKTMLPSIDWAGVSLKVRGLRRVTVCH